MHQFFIFKGDWSKSVQIQTHRFHLAAFIHFTKAA